MRRAAAVAAAAGLKSERLRSVRATFHGAERIDGRMHAFHGSGLYARGIQTSASSYLGYAGGLGNDTTRIVTTVYRTYFRSPAFPAPPGRPWLRIQNDDPDNLASALQALTGPDPLISVEGPASRVRGHQPLRGEPTTRYETRTRINGATRRVEAWIDAHGLVRRLHYRERPHPLHGHLRLSRLRREAPRQAPAEATTIAGQRVLHRARH